MEKWYAVMAKPRQERSASLSLEQAGIDTYYPEIKESLMVGGKRLSRQAGLFPGYFFARFDFQRQYRTVCYCRGVRKIVAFGHVPAEVEPEFLEDIKARIVKHDVVEIPTFSRGEIVRISHGPLAGLNAVFESAIPRKERVVLLLRMLFYQSRAVVQLSDIERYSEAV